MDIRQQILHFYRVEELSLREISRRTEADRKTVTRLINAFEAAIKENPETACIICKQESYGRLGKKKFIDGLNLMRKGVHNTTVYCKKSVG